MTIMPDWLSWIAHFTIFLTLGKWSGLKWQWAIGLIIGIEIWECSDWTRLDFGYWFSKLDTWIDMAAGCVAVFIIKKRWV